MTISPPNGTTILLVHGAWHGSWCWAQQIPAFHALGYDVHTVDLPCTRNPPGTTQFDDAAVVHSALKDLIAAGKRVVVLAHSYGGPIGSAGIMDLPLSTSTSSPTSPSASATASFSPGVIGLIVLCGYIFPSGMDQGAAIKAAGGLDWITRDHPSPGLFTINRPREKLYEPDVSADDVTWALAQLKPQSMAANMGIVPPQAWDTDEGRTFRGRLGYIKCTEDRAVSLVEQEGMIAAAGGEERWVVRTLEGAGHSPWLSRPGLLAAAVREIVGEFERMVV